MRARAWASLPECLFQIITKAGLETRGDGVALGRVVLGAVRANTLTVPRDALIRTEHETRVILALGDGKFRPVTVTPGIENAERAEILQGLRDGDEVVVNAQFLIDAESSQRAEYRRLGADTKPARP